MISFDDLYKTAFKLKARKMWRELPPFLIWGIETRDFGKFYVHCQINFEGNLCGFTALDEENGPYIIRAIHDNIRTDKVDHEVKKDLRMLSKGCSFIFAPKNLAESWPDLKEVQAYCKKNGIRPGGKNFYPLVKMLKVEALPWPLKEENEVKLAEKFMRATIALDNALFDYSFDPFDYAEMEPFADDQYIPGFKEDESGVFSYFEMKLPAQKKPAYPKPVWNDLQVARLKRKKKNGHVWLAEQLVGNEAVVDGEEPEPGKLPEQTPYYPQGLIVLDDSVGEMLIGETVSNEGGGLNHLSKVLFEAISEHGIPREIIVRTNKSYCFLKNYCRQLGIVLTMEKNHPVLEDVCNHFHNYEPGDEDEFDDLFDDYDEFEDLPPKEKRLKQVAKASENDGGFFDFDEEKAMAVMPPHVKEMYAYERDSLRRMFSTPEEIEAMIDILPDESDDSIATLLYLSLSHPNLPEAFMKALLNEYRKRRFSGRIEGLMFIPGGDDKPRKRGRKKKRT